MYVLAQLQGFVPPFASLPTSNAYSPFSPLLLRFPLLQFPSDRRYCRPLCSMGRCVVDSRNIRTFGANIVLKFRSGGIKLLKAIAKVDLMVVCAQ